MSLLLELAACVGAWVVIFLFGWFVVYLIDRFFGITKHLRHSEEICRTASNGQLSQDPRDAGLFYVMPWLKEKVKP